MILSINKPKDMTSRDVVNILTRKFETGKVGHTGTLDPMATGVLIICTHQDTKLVELLTSTEKKYIATIKLGIKTDTYDITGTVTEEKEYSHVTKEAVKETLNSFLGKYLQEVPKYSSVKVKGKKLYEYARNNIDIELPKREVEIKEIELLDFDGELIKFKTLVSKGTYIRSLINDICTKLNTVGCMSDLIRTKQGQFILEDSSSLEDIENNNYKIISPKEVLKDYPFEIVEGEKLTQIKNGAIIEKTFNDDYIVYLDNKDKIIAIYKPYTKDKTLAKPYKMLDNS